MRITFPFCSDCPIPTIVKRTKAEVSSSFLIIVSLVVNLNKLRESVPKVKLGQMCNKQGTEKAPTGGLRLVVHCLEI